MLRSADGRMARKAFDYQQVDLLREDLALGTTTMPINGSVGFVLVPKAIKVTLLAADVCVRTNRASTIPSPARFMAARCGPAAICTLVPCIPLLPYSYISKVPELPNLLPGVSHLHPLLSPAVDSTFGAMIGPLDATCMPKSPLLS